MEHITFNLAAAHTHGSAWYDFLKLRKSYFVDALHWDIPNDGTVEMDQYDTPQAWYSCVLDQGRLIGGARIMPTSAKWGNNGYMLGDAYKGMLPGIPSHALPELIESDLVWECTRLVVCSSVRDFADRARALELIVNGLVAITQDHDGQELITLTRISLMRTLRSLGYAVNRLGETYKGPDDGHRYAVLSMPAIASGHAIAAA